MTGGVSADPVNQIIGNEAFPLAAFSNNPLATRNEAHAPASVSFENLNHSGESTVGTGLYHLGKINTSQVIEFPASLGMTTGFMAVAKIPVKMIFRYAGTPIIAGIKYAGTVPADLDSDGGDPSLLGGVNVEEDDDDKNDAAVLRFLTQVAACW